MKEKIVNKIWLMVMAVTAVVAIGALCGRDNKSVIGSSAGSGVKYAVTYYTDADGGTIIGARNQQIKSGDNAVAVTAVPNEGYEFIKWSDDATTETRKDCNVQSDITVRPIFRKKQYDVVYSADFGGDIKGEPQQKVEHGRDAVTVTAVPNEGYRFEIWSDGSRLASRCDNNITSAQTLKAFFQKITYCKIEYLVINGTGGTVQGETVQNVEKGENGSAVVAVPNEGYEFEYWAYSSPNGSVMQYNTARTDCATTDMRYYAKFKRITFTVTYESSSGGNVLGRTTEKVYYGDSSVGVCAKPLDGYAFVGWSDGLKSAARVENNVKSDMKFTAYFGYSAEYKVNNNAGGIIIGETYQAVNPDADFSSVRAVPDRGYVFGGWSDLQASDIRKDRTAKRNVEYIAYFEPVIRTFDCDFGIASGVPMVNTITINRAELLLEGYPVPKIDGYTFQGWYADNRYKLKVINDTGKYMLGYYGFTLQTGTLYARWKPVENTGPTFKVLLLFVNEIDADLCSARNGGGEQIYNIHHVMATIDREYCVAVKGLVSKYLTEWLSELTDVEVDAFYTTMPASAENLIRGKYTTRYWMAPTQLLEVSPLVTSYHSVLSIYGLNGYDNVLNGGSTDNVREKFGEILLDRAYKIVNETVTLPKLLSKIDDNENTAVAVVQYYLHAIILSWLRASPLRTSPLCNDDKFDDAFKMVSYTGNANGIVEFMRKFCLCEAEYDSGVIGIPRDFWINKCDEMLAVNKMPYYL